MIRHIEGALPPLPPTEAAVRIETLHAAYAGTSVVRCFGDGRGGVLCLMDGHAVLSVGEMTPEWALFIAMQPEILTVRTSAPAARVLGQAADCAVTCGEVLCAPQGLQSKLPTDSASPREVYPVLQAGFGEAAPAFEPWYADVMLRLRRDLCRIVCVREGNTPVATAMTVAQGAHTALIGAVATHPDYRRRGYAGACVSALTQALQAQGKRVLLSPKNAAAAAVYAELGFTVCGTWGSAVKHTGNGLAV